MAGVENKPFKVRNGIVVGKDMPAILPSGPTSRRPKNPKEGAFRGNTDTNSVEMFLNGNWVNVGSGILGIGLPVTENATLLDAAVYVVDTRSGPVTITLSDDPSPSSTIRLIDPFNSWAANPVTVVAPPYAINGEMGNLVLRDNSVNASITFIDPTIGWRTEVTPIELDALRFGGIRNNDFVAESRFSYAVDTSVAIRTVTLPANPKAGDTIELYDYSGTFEVDSLKINPNNKRISNRAGVIEVKTKDAYVVLKFVDDTHGWLMYVVTSPRLNYTLTAGSKLTANSTVLPNLAYEIDSTAGAFNIILPAPALTNLGDEITLFDVSGKLGVNPVTIDANTAKINGVVGNLLLKTPNTAYTLRYQSIALGWQLSVGTRDANWHLSPSYAGAITTTVILNQAGVYSLNHAGAITVTLPANPVSGEKVIINDVANKLAAGNVTVTGGTAKINGVVGGRRLTKDGTHAAFTFLSATGWFMSISDGEENVPDKKMTIAPVKAVDFTTEALFNYPVNTASSTVTVQLHANPLAGDRVELFDYNNTWDVHAITVDPNGKKIDGVAGTAVNDNRGGSLSYVYVDATIGWKQLSVAATTKFDVVNIVNDGQVLAAGNIYVIDMATAFYEGNEVGVPLATGQISAKLPAAPKVGDELHIYDSGYSFGENPLSIDGNGKSIGNRANLLCNITGSYIRFEFLGAAIGWKAEVSHANAFGDSVHLDSLTPKSAAFTARANTRYLVDTTTESVAVALPEYPFPGDTVILCDVFDKFRVQPVVVNGIANKIDGETNDYVLSDLGAYTFTFTGEGMGWSCTADLVPQPINYTSQATFTARENSINVISGSATVAIPAGHPVGSTYDFNTERAVPRGKLTINAPQGHTNSWNKTRSLVVCDDTVQVSMTNRGSLVYDVTLNKQALPPVKEAAGGVVTPGRTTFIENLSMYEDGFLRIEDMTGVDIVGDVVIRVLVEETLETPLTLIDWEGTELAVLNRGYDYVCVAYSEGWWDVSYIGPAPEEKPARSYVEDNTVNVSVLDQGTTYALDVRDGTTELFLSEGVADGRTIEYSETGRHVNCRQLKFVSDVGQKINGSVQGITVVGAMPKITFEFVGEDTGWVARVSLPRSTLAPQPLQTADFWAKAGGSYIIDTQDGPVSAWLPQTAYDGDIVAFHDVGGALSTNAFTISPQGKLIDGSEIAKRSIENYDYIEVTYRLSTGWMTTHQKPSTFRYDPVVEHVTNDVEIVDYNEGEINYVSLVVSAVKPNVILPLASPSTAFLFVDKNRSWGTAKPIFSANGEMINGSLNNLSPEKDGQMVKFTYIDATVGWAAEVIGGLSMKVAGTVTSNTRLVAETVFIVDASAAQIELTTPSTAAPGDRLVIADANKQWHVKGVKLIPDGVKVDGSLSPRIYTNPGSTIVLQNAGAIGWVTLSEHSEAVTVAVTDGVAHSNLAAGVTYAVAVNSAISMALPATPKLNDVVKIRSTVDGNFLKHGLIVTSAKKINFEATSYSLRSDRVVYVFTYTEDEWMVSTQNVGIKTVASNMRHEALQSHTATITTTSTLRAENVQYNVDASSGSVVLTLADPTYDCEVSFHDVAGTLSKTKTVTLKAGANVNAIGATGKELVLDRPHSYVRLRYSARNNMFYVEARYPDAELTTIEYQGTRNSSFTATGGNSYIVDAVSSVVVTLDEATPVGKTVTISGDSSWEDFPVTVTSASGINGKPSLVLANPYTALTLIRALGGWTVQSLAVGGNHHSDINLLVNGTSLLGNVNYYITPSGGTDMVLPANVPLGTWVGVAGPRTGVFLGTLKVSPTGAEKINGAASAMSLSSNDKQMLFRKVTEGWVGVYVDRGLGLVPTAKQDTPFVAAIGAINNVDATGAPIAVTVPLVASIEGTLKFVVVDTDGQASTNPITITATEGIGEGTTHIISKDGGYVELTRFAGDDKWTVTSQPQGSEAGGGSYVNLTSVTPLSNFTAESGKLYKITNANVTSIVVPNGQVADRFAVHVKRGASVTAPIDLTGADVNSSSLIKLTKEDALYEFTYLDGLGWKLNETVDIYHMFNRLEKTLSVGYGVEESVTVVPRTVHTLGVSNFGNRVVWNINIANWTDGQQAAFEVMDVSRGHGVLWPQAGTKIAGSELPLNLNSGDFLLIEYRVEKAGFIILSHSRRSTEEAAGFVPLDTTTNAVPTLGAVNMPHPINSGNHNFIMDVRWPSGTIVTFADPFRRLDGVINYITLQGAPGQTVGGKTTFRISAPGNQYKVVLQGTDWKVMEVNHLTASKFDVSSNMTLNLGHDYNITALLAPITLTLPDLSAIDSDHAIDLVDTGGTIGQYPVTLATGPSATFHDGSTTKVLKVPYGTARLKFRCADNKWIVERLSTESAAEVITESLDEDKTLSSGIVYVRAGDGAVGATLPATLIAGKEYHVINNQVTPDANLTINLSGASLDGYGVSPSNITVSEAGRYLVLVATGEHSLRVEKDSRMYPAVTSTLAVTTGSALSLKAAKAYLLNNIPSGIISASLPLASLDGDVIEIKAVDGACRVTVTGSTEDVANTSVQSRVVRLLEGQLVRLTYRGAVGVWAVDILGSVAAMPLTTITPAANNDVTNVVSGTSYTFVERQANNDAWRHTLDMIGVSYSPAIITVPAFAGVSVIAKVPGQFGNGLSEATLIAGSTYTVSQTGSSTWELVKTESSGQVGIYKSETNYTNVTEGATLVYAGGDISVTTHPAFRSGMSFKMTDPDGLLGNGSFTFTPPSPELVNGAASFAITSRFESVTFHKSGGTWVVSERANFLAASSGESLNQLSGGAGSTGLALNAVNVLSGFEQPTYTPALSEASYFDGDTIKFRAPKPELSTAWVAPVTVSLAAHGGFADGEQSKSFIDSAATYRLTRRGGAWELSKDKTEVEMLAKLAWPSVVSGANVTLRLGANNVITMADASEDGAILILPVPAQATPDNVYTMVTMKPNPLADGVVSTLVAGTLLTPEDILNSEANVISVHSNEENVLLFEYDGKSRKHKLVYQIPEVPSIGVSVVGDNTWDLSTGNEIMEAGKSYIVSEGMLTILATLPVTKTLQAGASVTVQLADTPQQAVGSSRITVKPTEIWNAINGAPELTITAVGTAVTFTWNGVQWDAMVGQGNKLEATVVTNATTASNQAIAMTLSRGGSYKFVGNADGNNSYMLYDVLISPTGMLKGERIAVTVGAIPEGCVTLRAATAILGGKFSLSLAPLDCVTLEYNGSAFDVASVYRSGNDAVVRTIAGATEGTVEKNYVYAGTVGIASGTNVNGTGYFLHVPVNATEGDTIIVGDRDALTATSKTAVTLIGNGNDTVGGGFSTQLAGSTRMHKLRFSAGNWSVYASSKLNGAMKDYGNIVLVPLNGNPQVIDLSQGLSAHHFRLNNDTVLSFKGATGRVGTSTILHVLQEQTFGGKKLTFASGDVPLSVESQYSINQGGNATTLLKVTETDLGVVVANLAPKSEELGGDLVHSTFSPDGDVTATVGAHYIVKAGSTVTLPTAPKNGDKLLVTTYADVYNGLTQMYATIESNGAPESKIYFSGERINNYHINGVNTTVAFAYVSAMNAWMITSTHTESVNLYDWEPYFADDGEVSFPLHDAPNQTVFVGENIPEHGFAIAPILYHLPSGATVEYRNESSNGVVSLNMQPSNVGAIGPNGYAKLTMVGRVITLVDVDRGDLSKVKVKLRDLPIDALPEDAIITEAVHGALYVPANTGAVNTIIVKEAEVGDVTYAHSNGSEFYVGDVDGLMLLNGAVMRVIANIEEYTVDGGTETVIADSRHIWKFKLVGKDWVSSIHREIPGVKNSNVVINAAAGTVNMARGIDNHIVTIDENTTINITGAAKATVKESKLVVTQSAAGNHSLSIAGDLHPDSVFEISPAQQKTTVLKLLVVGNKVLVTNYDAVIPKQVAATLPSAYAAGGAAMATAVVLPANKSYLLGVGGSPSFVKLSSLPENGDVVEIMSEVWEPWVSSVTVVTSPGAVIKNSFGDATTTVIADNSKVYRFTYNDGVWSATATSRVDAVAGLVPWMGLYVPFANIGAGMAYMYQGSSNDQYRELVFPGMLDACLEPVVIQLAISEQIRDPGVSIVLNANGRTFNQGPATYSIPAVPGLWEFVYSPLLRTWLVSNKSGETLMEGTTGATTPNVRVSILAGIEYSVPSTLPSGSIVHYSDVKRGLSAVLSEYASATFVPEAPMTVMGAASFTFNEKGGNWSFVNEGGDWKLISSLTPYGGVSDHHWQSKQDTTWNATTTTALMTVGTLYTPAELVNVAAKLPEHAFTLPKGSTIAILMPYSPANGAVGSKVVVSTNDLGVTINGGPSYTIKGVGTFTVFTWNGVQWIVQEHVNRRKLKPNVLTSNGDVVVDVSNLSKYVKIDATGNINITGITTSVPLTEIQEFSVLINAAADGISITVSLGVNSYTASSNLISGLAAGDKVSLQGYTYEGNIYYSMVPLMRQSA